MCVSICEYAAGIIICTHTKGIGIGIGIGQGSGIWDLDSWAEWVG